jgi:hypothetical protein
MNCPRILRVAAGLIVAFGASVALCSRFPVGSVDYPFTTHARGFSAQRLFALIPCEARLPRDPRRVAARNLPSRFGCLEKC